MLDSHVVAEVAATSVETTTRLLLRNTVYRATYEPLGLMDMVTADGVTATDIELHYILAIDRHEEERLAEEAGEYVHQPGTVRDPNPSHEGSDPFGPDGTLR